MRTMQRNGWPLLTFLISFGCSDAQPSHLAGGPNDDNPAIKFDHSAAQIKALCDDELAKLRDRIDDIAKAPDAAFATTAEELEDAFADFWDALNPPIFLADVATERAVRDAAQACSTAVSTLQVDTFARADLYTGLKAARAKNETLDAQDLQLIDDYLKEFRRNGLELPKDKLTRLIEIKKKLVDLANEFSRNLAEWSDTLEVTRAQLNGLPEDYIAGLKKSDTGLYKVTLAYPDYFPFMENATDEASRKALEYKYSRRGGDRNRTILADAIKLRTEAAQLLGYKTHVDFVLEQRMAKTPAAVNAFLDDLKAKLIPKGQAELQELMDLKRQQTGNAQRINSWDWRFYDSLLVKTRHQVDAQVVKEYFPLDAVLTGMFEIYQTLLGVRFVALPKAAKWHQDVNGYAVQDPKTGATLSYFYMDLFPRDGKYGHAAAFTLRSGRDEGHAYVRPISSIVANFSKPAAGNPSLLLHDEVETLFHEFGHIMHQVLTTARYATFSGTATKRDFVEAPSQMLENWVWQKSALAKLARHYSTGKGLPDDLLNKMLAAKQVDVGLKYLRQLTFATLDMEYHSTTDGKVDTTAVYERLAKDVWLIPIQQGTIPEASFGHLMGGYDAGYYGYLWSEVFAQDMFTRFADEGLLNTKTGADYRKWILQPGGTRDPLDLIRGFLGREPNSDAFLCSLGIKQKSI